MAASPSEAEVADLAAAFYDAALDTALWPGTLEQLRAAFGAVTANITAYDLAKLEGFVLNAGGDPAATESYVAHYGKLDPLIAPLRRQPTGQALNDEMALPKAMLTRSEYYADWLRPQGLWHALLAATMRDGPLTGGLCITRGPSQKQFDENEMAALEALLPHLGRAVRTTCRLAAAEAREAGVEALLGRLREAALLLGADGTVLYANPAAEALLSAGDGLTTARGRLCATRPADDAALRRALAGAAGNGGGTLAVARPSGRAPLAVAVQPASASRLSASDPWRVGQVPTALVFVMDPDPGGGAATVRTLRALYGLTAAEAAVAEAIAQGQGVAEASEALGVAQSTLRWHLQRVFDKTGTARQAQLARLVERRGATGGQWDDGA